MEGRRLSCARFSAVSRSCGRVETACVFFGSDAAVIAIYRIIGAVAGRALAAGVIVMAFQANTYKYVLVFDIGLCSGVP